jgi:hypothetical protein
MAVPPRSVASCEASAPPIFPKGVRAAPRITVLGMWRNATEWATQFALIRLDATTTKRAMGRFYPRARYLKTAPEFESRGGRRR